jgi:uncharacterized protein
MLGFDTFYRNDYQDADIIVLALRERRIILTRDRGLLQVRAVTYGYWMRSTVPSQQVREVLQRFDLQGLIRPFHRCLRCNGGKVRRETDDSATSTATNSPLLSRVFSV